MEYKPTITYLVSSSTDESLFLTLITHLKKMLQQEVVEWKRSYGRAPHKLTLDVKFLPLTAALLKRSDLVTRPYFHTFWTDVSDVDSYRSIIRPEISNWLLQVGTTEWMIVVISGDGVSKASKSKILLPKSSIVDKIKADFCSKHPQRVQVLQDPFKDSTKAADSWSLLSSRLANFSILSLEQAVTKYEDCVRTERERRNDKSWNFCSYFMMQEELAFVFEMLSLHEEALIQYNELDAMFTQYLLNARVGDVAHWLSSFMKPITRWRSLSLWRQIDGDARQMLIDDNASLIDVRNYLFARHCHLLFVTQDLKSVTDLMHNFLPSTTLELDILEIDMPIGAKDCWVFMSCMELAQSLERMKDHFSTHNTDIDCSKLMNMTSNELKIEIANLWNLARSKLLNLGVLCGLMPDVDTSSKHLQTVVELISGIGDEEERDSLVKSPCLILREALSSKDNFRKRYLELSELAMGTFKHAKRYRSAKSIGKDLAEFYMRSGEPAKAEIFLRGCVRMYTHEAWPYLITNASERLAECYKQMVNVRRYARMCCALMCNSILTQEKRSFYCDELQSLSTDLGDSNLSILLAVFAGVKSIQFMPAKTLIPHKSKQHLSLSVTSKAPKPIHFHSLQLSLRYCDYLPDDSPTKSVFSDMPKEEKADTMTYTMFSSDEEETVEDIESASTHFSSRKVGIPKIKQRRFLSMGSFDSGLRISQKTPLGTDGTIQLIPIEEPYTEPSKCIANRLPPMIHLAYESEEKEDDILWTGITCRSAKQLLKRQDSCQSLCSLHSSTTNIVVEECQDSVLLNNVTLHPGDNYIKIEIDTIKPGQYTLRQLNLSINKIHFVLPWVLPVISYTITKNKPKLCLSHQPRYCNILQNVAATLSTEDYDLKNDLGNYKMSIAHPLHMKILKFEILSVETERGVEIQYSLPEMDMGDVMSSIMLPQVSSHTVITFSFSCIFSQPLTQELSHRYHRRSQSAPNPTIHKHAQSVCMDYDSLDQSASERKPRAKTASDFGAHQFSFGQRNSPVKKFLTFVREVADLVETKSLTKSDKRVLLANENGRVEHDEFLEVVLDDCDGTDNRLLHDSRDKPWASSVTTTGDNISSTETRNVLGILSGKVQRTSKAGVPEFQMKQHHTVPVCEESPLEGNNKAVCNVSFFLPWDDLPPISASFTFIKLLEFSNKSLISYAIDKVHSSVSIIKVISVQVENRSPHTFLLRNCCLTHTTTGITLVGLQNISEKKVNPSQKFIFAWKIHFGDVSPSICNIHFHCDVSSDGKEPSASSSYKFEIQNIQPLYSVSMQIGSDGEELVVGQMTSLNITVKRIGRDPELEHTYSGQQLLMYQVIDTRGRWAVCGKSTGVLSLPVSLINVAGLGTPVAKVSLEIMPLLHGLLHRPSVVLQRYLKRRSGEFDEQLSSIESPVLKPPKLMDFLSHEIVNIDRYKQVSVLETFCKHRIPRGDEDGEVLTTRITQL